VTAFDPYLAPIRTLVTVLGFEPEKIPLNGGIAIDKDGYLVVTELEWPVRAVGHSLATLPPRRFRVTVEEVQA